MAAEHLCKVENHRFLLYYVREFGQPGLRGRKDEIMRFLGNLLWLILGGFIAGLSWILTGILLCITVVGIPLGVQCFKFAKLAFCPFGKEVIYGGGAVSLLANILWLLFIGLWMAIASAAAGLVLYITIIGIPFGKQYFKLARLWLMPFGASVV